MRISSFLLVASVAFSLAPSLHSQQPPRDRQAAAILQAAATAMGGTVPSDSVATGSVVVVAGSKTDTGTIRILTRGTDQTAELIQISDGTRALIYSGGQAAKRDGASSKRQSLELSASSQSPNFPMPVIAGVLSDPDAAFQYLGREALLGFPVHHIRFWKTYPANPRLAHLAEFSKKDIWIDVASLLPRKFYFQRFEGRPSRGPSRGIRFEVSFLDYRSINGVLYPFRIEKSLNGTPWATITVQTVTFNTGLTEADFPLR